MKEEELIEKGREIYKTLEPRLVPFYKGQYCVISVPEREYFVNTSLIEALRQAAQKYPERQFFSIKIGEKGIATFRG